MSPGVWSLPRQSISAKRRGQRCFLGLQWLICSCPPFCLGGGWGTRAFALTHPALVRAAKAASGGCAAPLLSCKAPFIQGYRDCCCATRDLFNVFLFLSLARQNLAAAGLGECGCVCTRGASSESVSGQVSARLYIKSQD